MFNRAEPPQNLGAFGMGVAVGLGAGLAIRAISPNVFNLVEAVLSKFGFNIGEILLSLWNPEKRIKPALQLTDNRPASRKKSRRKTKARAQRRTKIQVVRKSSRKATPLLVSPTSRLRRREIMVIGAN